MIGFVVQMLGLGLPGEGFCGIIAGSFLAICAVCGLYKCSSLRMRDCSCIKRCMRATGTDQFDDFELTLLVHEVTYTASQLKMHTKVRVTAGDHVVSTDQSNRGVYQQIVQLLVEQGAKEVKLELMDADKSKVLAVKRLDVMKDILDPKNRETEMVYSMKQQSKVVLNPKIKITKILDSDGNMEQGLLAGINVSPEANIMLRQQIQKEKAEFSSGDENSAGVSGSDAVGSMAQDMSQVDLLMKVCKGPLEKFGSWGRRSNVYIATRGPPHQRKYTLGVWKSQADFEKNIAPDIEVDLMKILGVMPDPHPKRVDVFVINYVKDNQKDRLTFRRIDRNRDVWVETFLVLIKTLREQKEGRARAKKR
jgi:hypothetical protein